MGGGKRHLNESGIGVQGLREQKEEGKRREKRKEKRRGKKKRQTRHLDASVVVVEREK